MSRLKPLGSEILIARFREERMSLNGLVITSSVEKQRKGRVLAVGPKVINIQEGDIVHLPVFPGRELRSGKRVAELHDEKDIVAKYDK